MGRPDLVECLVAWRDKKTTWAATLETWKTHYTVMGEAVKRKYCSYGLGEVANESNSPGKKEALMAGTTDSGIITIASNHPVDQTVEKLKGILQSKGVTLFALVDHSGEAEKVGLKMPPTKLVIFGTPRAGTPLMLAAPSIAIDLPLKILVWEDARGKAWLSHNAPDYLRDRHGISQNLLQNIEVVATLAAKAAE